jgi:hypothetical protein
MAAMIHFSMSDSQLQALCELAEPLPPELRSELLRLTAAELAGVEPGDGRARRLGQGQAGRASDAMKPVKPLHAIAARPDESPTRTAGALDHHQVDPTDPTLLLRCLPAARPIAPALEAPSFTAGSIDLRHDQDRGRDSEL